MNRVRSSVSEDLGSLLDAVEAIPVDLGFDVAFTNAVSQEPAQLMLYRELTRATDSPTVDLVVYPRPQQNTVMEEQFSGVTVLSRLATWYPPRSRTRSFCSGSRARPATAASTNNPSPRVDIERTSSLQ